MKVCSKCQQELPLDMFYSRRSDCKSCTLKERKNYYDSNIAADRRLRSKYGITLEQYNLMLEKQKGVCAICHQYSVDRPDSHKRMPVDHNHTTGAVRGILCNRCNLVLGKMGDNIELFQNTINYLNTHSN